MQGKLFILNLGSFYKINNLFIWGKKAGNESIFCKDLPFFS